MRHTLEATVNATGDPKQHSSKHNDFNSLLFRCIATLLKNVEWARNRYGIWEKSGIAGFGTYGAELRFPSAAEAAIHSMRLAARLKPRPFKTSASFQNKNEVRVFPQRLMPRFCRAYGAAAKPHPFKSVARI
jgi:hypothetical protein